jgi:hypothetical protein
MGPFGRRILSLLFSFACFFALVGCSGGTTSATHSTKPKKSSSSTTSTAKSATTTPSTTPTTAATTPGSTTPSSGTTTCMVSNLVLSQSGSGGGAGTLEVTYALRNSGSTTCTLYGYPGAQMFDSSGSPIKTTVVPGGNYPFTNFTPALVSLAAGASGYFNLGYTDVPSGGETSCPTASNLKVIPPNDYTQLTVAFHNVVCNDGTLTLSPVFSSTSPHTSTTAP